MRTTLTLEPDLAALVRRAVRDGKRSLKDVINDALRRGLEGPREPGRSGYPGDAHAHILGRLLPHVGANLVPDPTWLRSQLSVA